MAKHGRKSSSSSTQGTSTSSTSSTNQASSSSATQPPQSRHHSSRPHDDHSRLSSILGPSWRDGRRLRSRKKRHVTFDEENRDEISEEELWDTTQTRSAEGQMRTNADRSDVELTGDSSTGNHSNRVSHQDREQWTGFAPAPAPSAGGPSLEDPASYQYYPEIEPQRYPDINPDLCSGPAQLSSSAASGLAAQWDSSQLQDIAKLASLTSGNNG
ncbi:hypothetical protein CI109_100126 [Kwoniella shandongensis]|uniref:Uncharacterized protein n=1 Tax=Kwoniella shandongensis TaxID=1734106 RepID=A0A5M6BPZ3_9TREE|nr:uncharacterized protein CI109_006846 [Kwoniella shandongensis]KAA5524823.1 hypothetical protein CI109_006846 [Kwoniella shandongensis]